MAVYVMVVAIDMHDGINHLPLHPYALWHSLRGNPYLKSTKKYLSGLLPVILGVETIGVRAKKAAMEWWHIHMGYDEAMLDQTTSIWAIP